MTRISFSILVSIGVDDTSGGVLDNKLIQIRIFTKWVFRVRLISALTNFAMYLYVRDYPSPCPSDALR